jgi:hypothetical protein
MTVSDKQNYIRQKARENAHDPSGRKVLWSRHAVAALVDDGLLRTDVEAALQHGWVIEDYPPARRPLPDCLVFATLVDGCPIHAVVAIDESNDRIFIVTVYKPTGDRWEDDWQTRKS